MSADVFTPAIVQGRVWHRRTRPVVHAFAYPAFCVRLPLSQLDALPARGVARNRLGAIAFRDRDHGPRDGSPLLPWIRALLESQGIASDGEVLLYTFPRVLGYVFNPVSFWVCHDRERRPRAVVAEVSNTFGERHVYVVAHADGRPVRSGETLTATKSLHVSPFCAVRGHYAFRFAFVDDRWLARVDYFDEQGSGSPLIETAISGVAVPMTRASVRRLLVRHAAFTLGVVVRIHWQALKLWSKNVPVFHKPPAPVIATTRATR